MANFNKRMNIIKRMKPCIQTGKAIESRLDACCAKCGLVGHPSLEKPQRMGYYINLVALLGNDVKITKVQMRLIALELKKLGLDDIHNINRCCQERLFIQTVKRYINIPEQTIQEILKK